LGISSGISRQNKNPEFGERKSKKKKKKKKQDLANQNQRKMGRRQGEKMYVLFYFLSSALDLPYFLTIGLGRKLHLMCCIDHSSFF